MYLTQNVSVNLAGLNMFAVRFLEIAGFVRVMAHREFSFSNLNDIDRAFLLFYSYTTIIFLLRSNEGQAYQIGLAVDAVFCYFTFRGLVRDLQDLTWFLGAFVILLVPYVALLFIEMRTSHNPFSILGGAPIVEHFRNGRVRCVGSFREYSLLGSLGASFLPLYIGFSFPKSGRIKGVTGGVLCLAIVGFSNSGSPLAFACLAVLGWMFWPFRRRMRTVRRAGVVGLIATAILMKAPIWYLPTHLTFGGDAWHRSYLISVTMGHIREWWLWGMPLSKTTHWFPYVDTITGTADITNQYISFGLAAGLVAIALFLLPLIRAFRNLGVKLAEARTGLPCPPETEYLLWGLGVMLAAHMANFFSITYFDQFYVIWFLQLATISSLTCGYGFVHVPVELTPHGALSCGQAFTPSLYRHQSNGH
ncbi:MAG: hypothetical protein ACP5SH_21070 [Syntrophobacteraceae bacterium]